MKKAYTYGIGGALAVLLCAAFFAHAAVPAVINYQSRLRTSAGAAITTATKVSFSLYSVATGGSALWTESYSQSSGACAKVRPDSNGYFSVQMGSCEAFPATLTFTTPLFLGVTIENDPEASPRVAFAPAPYAMNAVRVGNFVSDTSVGTLTGEPLGTATAGTQGFNSASLALRGSVWDPAESSAVSRDFIIRNTSSNSVLSRLSVFGGDSTSFGELVSVLNNGRVGIGITNPQSELEVAGVIYANDFRTRGGSISTTGDGTNDLIRFTRPKLLIGHTADLNVVGPITNLMQLTATDVTFLENASFNKLLSVPSRQIKFGLNTFTFPVAAPASDGLVLTTDSDGTLSWTAKSTGSVTSVGLSAPSDFTVSGSPVTASGTLDFAWKNQQPNDVLAGPPSGSVAGAPVFRPLASADIPNLSADKVTSGTLNIDRIPDIPSTKVTGVLGVANIPDLAADKITSGTFAAARIPALGASQIPDLSADKITSGTLNADRVPVLDITAKTSGTLGVTRGGTGIASTEKGDIIFSDAINSLAALGIGSTGKVLTVSPAGLPIWSDPATNGTVTSVGLTAPSSVFTVSGSPVTGSGDLALDLATQTKNEIFAAPIVADGKPSFRSLVSADIPDLTAAKITSGTFGVGLIPDLAADKITSGIFDAARIPALGVAQIPDLSADKITSGIFGIGRIPDLDAGKISTGIFNIDRIPDIPSTKVTGVLGVANIPDLAADKITSGTFAAARIPALGASQIPDLSADKITSGTLDTDRIPVLDIATKTSGTLGVTRGGTGIAATAKGDILFSDAINSLAALGIGSTGNVLTVNSAGLPVWSAPPATGVTSVGLALPSLFTVGGSPVTASGTLSATLAVQGRNTFFGGPVSGADATPDFRALDAQDIPNISADKITSGVFSAARIPAIASSSVPDLDAGKITTGIFDIARIPNIPAANIAGVLASSSIPSIDASKIGSGVLGTANGGTGLSTVGADGTVLTATGGVPAWRAVPAGLGGSGVFGQLAFWNASSTLAGNSNLIIDTVNSRLSIGSSAAPATTLVVAGDTTVGGDVVPSTASAYDFGSTGKPARSVYSDNLGSATARIKKAYIDELYIFGGAGGSGTSTISATQTVFNGIAYNWPNGGLGNNFVLTTDTNGNLGWQNPTNLVPESGWRSSGTGNVRLGVITDKVGVGTATPATKLDVVGDIQASGFLSSASGQIKFGGATYSFPTSLPSSGQILAASSTPGNLQFRNLAATDIPVLDASKITTGVFSSAQIPAVSSSSIPNLDASKITTGVFNIARIPSIPVAQGGTGLSSVGANGTVLTVSGGVPAWQAIPAGLGGSGIVGRLPLWSATGTISSSALSQSATEISTSMNTRLSGTVWLGEDAASGAQVGIYAPTRLTSSLSVNGPSFLRGDINIGMPNGPEQGVGVLKINNGSLFIPFGAADGKVLTSDATGNAAWRTPASGIGGSGTANTLPVFSATGTISDSFVTQTANDVRILGKDFVNNATTTLNKLSAAGDVRLPGNVYIGNAAAGTTLIVSAATTTIGGSFTFKGNGGIQYTSGFGLGKVLTSDANGNATWQAPTGGVTLLGASTGTIPLVTGTSTLGNSSISQTATSTVISGALRITNGGSPSLTVVGNANFENSGITMGGVGVIDASRNGIFENLRANGTMAMNGTTTARTILPANDNTWDLGSPTARWRDIYVGPSTIKVVGAGGQIIESIGEGSGANVGKLVVKSSSGERLIGAVSSSNNFGNWSKVNSSTRPADIFYNTAWSDSLGRSGVGFVGIGNSAPTEMLDVTGTVKMSGLRVVPPAGVAVAGRVLTADSNGTATWQELPAPTPPATSGFGDFTSVTVGGSASSYLAVSGNTSLRSTNIGIAGGSSTLTLNGSVAGLTATTGGRMVVGSDSSGAVKWVDPLAGIRNIHLGDTDIDATMGLTSRMLSIATIAGSQTRNAAYHNIYSDETNVLKFAIAGNPKMTLKNTGLEVSGTVKANGVTLTSDRRLKDDIVEISPVLSKLDALYGVNFTWRGDKSKKKQLGVIAQDVEKSFPELVDADSQTGMKSVNYSGLAAVAIQGVKELDAKVDAATPAVGEGRIAVGESSVTIMTPKAFSTAKIFVTPMGSTGGQVLYVDTIVEGKSFTVKTDKAVRSPARFNWMIIK